MVRCASQRVSREFPGPSRSLLQKKGKTAVIGAEPRFQGPVGARTLETGKSPTTTRWRAELPVVYSGRRFPSSLRRRAVELCAQPAVQSPGDVRTYVSSYGYVEANWARFVKENCGPQRAQRPVREKTPPFSLYTRTFIKTQNNKNWQKPV